MSQVAAIKKHGKNDKTSTKSPERTSSFKPPTWFEGVGESIEARATLRQ